LALIDEHLADRLLGGIPSRQAITPVAWPKASTPVFLLPSEPLTFLER